MLDFRNPVFHPGLNVTVRAGDEYVDHPTVKPGATVTLGCTERGLEFGPALIVSTQHFESVAAVPPSLLLFEHVPTCRDDPAELHRQLTDCYGTDYGPGVTLVFFYHPFHRA